MSSLDGWEGLRTRNAPSLLPAVVVAVAVLAGLFSAVAGAMAGYRAIYYLAVVGLVAVGAGIALTRPEPLRFSFLLLIAVLPLTNILVPPGRLGFTIFDVASVLLAAGLLLRKMFASADAPLFPARSLAFVWLLLIPCAVLARYPIHSSQQLLLIFAAYVFFWFVLQELRRPLGFERLTSLLAVVLIVVAAGVFIESFLHINLSLRGTNLNQVTYVGGVAIWRAGGFFQDPQKAGAFMASLIALLSVLCVRHRFASSGMRLLAWSAILLAMMALFMTVSRAAILACLLASGASLVLFNRWPATIKILTVCSLMLIVMGLMLTPNLWLVLLPTQLAERLANSQVEFMQRVEIWFDTWDMFANQPLTGIGFGGFQRYLIETRPLVFNFYGIGSETGSSYIPDQPESGYFKILYESGILGTLAALILLFETLRRALIGVADSTPEMRTEVVAALAGLLAFGATFATQFTAGDPRILALLAILLAVIWRPSLPQSTVRA